MNRPEGPSRLRLGQAAMLTALACAIVLASLAATPGAAGLLGAALGLLMLAIAVIDARAFLIPDELNFVALALAFVQAASLGEPGPAEAVLLAALRAGALALTFLAVRVSYRWWRGRQGLGLGDVKLAAVAGAWLDWMLMPVAIEIAALAALGFYLARHLVTGRPLSRTTRLPFGLFLAPSIWCAWLIGAVLFPA